MRVESNKGRLRSQESWQRILGKGVCADRRRNRGVRRNVRQVRRKERSGLPICRQGGSGSLHFVLARGNWRVPETRIAKRFQARELRNSILIACFCASTITRQRSA